MKTNHDFNVVSKKLEMVEWDYGRLKEELERTQNLNSKLVKKIEKLIRK